MSSGSLFAALLLVVAATNFGYEPLAALYDDPGAAARSWFYVLRGMEGAALYWVVWRMLPLSWSHSARRCVGAVCLWGGLEGAQSAVCRLAQPMGEPAAAVPPYAGLCDVIAGFPVSALTAGIILAITLLVEAP